MTLRNSCSVVKVGQDLSEPFDSVSGFRQGELLSCDLFNFVMESVLRKARVHHNGTIFQESDQLLAYSDVIPAFSAIDRESTNIALGLKTKQSLVVIDKRRIDFQITADNYTFNTVMEFIYLGSDVTTKNDVSLMIKRSITLANRCYYGLNMQLSN